MNGGDAAEQTVRLAMEGAEFTLKIAGEGAERILALLMAALQPAPKGQKESGSKRRGRERLKTMLKKSGEQIKFFEIQGKDLKEFKDAAKQYRLKYCVLWPKGNANGMVEIVAKAEDAARVSRILEKLEARDLGGGSCEQTKSKAEIKAEQKATEQAAKKKQQEGVHTARQEFNARRNVLREQYNKDIGREPKPPRERRVPQSRIGQLLQELTTEIARRIPVIGALVRRREEATAPAEPEHETPAQDVADSLLAQPAEREGQAQPEAPAATRKEEPAAHPPARTERKMKDPPSTPSSPTRQNGGGIISNEQGGKPSVQAFLDTEIARRREQKKQPEKAKQPRGKSQKPKQPQRKKTKPKKER